MKDYKCIYKKDNKRCKHYATISGYCTQHWNYIIKRGMKQIQENETKSM